MAELFYDDDADLSIIQGRHVAVIGYGSQGHAHALNLRDSGVDVRVGLPEGSKSTAKAEAEGLRVRTVAEAVEEADVIVDPRARPGAASRLRRVTSSPTWSTATPSSSATASTSASATSRRPRASTSSWSPPRRPGHTVRREFVDGRGIPDIIAVEQDASGKAWDLALSYAKAIGGTRAGVIKTTFTEETETDLFGEQAVLCGGMSHLVQAGLRDADRGRLPARDRLLRGAARAQAHRRPHVGGRHRQAALEHLRHRRVRRLRLGPAHHRRLASRSACRPCSPTSRTARSPSASSTTRTTARTEFLALREKEAGHPIEATGKILRSHFSWKQQDADYIEGSAAR